MYTTDAIILKKEGAGEADLLITALTPNFVRVRLVAQGARKVGAKLKGHLEPLSLSRLSFVVGKNNYRLVGADLQNFFPTIKSDSERFRVAYEISRLLESALFEDKAGTSGDFFKPAREALFFMEDSSKTSDELKAAALWFRLKFLYEAGLLPDEFTMCLVPCGDFVAKMKGMDADRLHASAEQIFKTYTPF